MKSVRIPVLAGVVAVLALLSTPGDPALAVTTFTVTNTTNSGVGSLRQAITDANNAANVGGADVINFNIPSATDPGCNAGTGVCTITLATSLTTITQPLTVNGTTQPGFAGSPLIELNGNSVANAGLTITGGSSTVQGLAINRFTGNGITLASGSNTISGNYIGTDVTGSSDLGNGTAGIRISSVTGGNTVGGTVASARNIISGNGGGGIEIQPGTGGGNVIQGNYIGVNASGNAALGNTGSGIHLNGAGNCIGGSSASCLVTAGAGNVISGNTFGIQINNAGATGNIIISNKIGTGANATVDAGNQSHGIFLSVAGAGDNTVGGTTGTTTGGACTGSCNLIAFNGGDGISAQGGTGNQFRRNSIHSNTGLGIDLAPDGVTENDISLTPPTPQHDADTGVNNLQNFPDLSQAVKKGSTTQVSVFFRSAPSTVYTFEFFSSATCDGSGNGEGTTLVGSVAVLTNSLGVSGFSETLSVGVPVGHFITATASQTDASVPSDTSEFSDCVQVGPMVVDTTAFTSLTSCQVVPADCSLLGAINNANTGGGADTIVFNIPPGGTQTITPDNPLPAIVEDLTINGTTQPGFAGSPIIELNGQTVSGSLLAGLRVTAGTSTIRGLVINRFGGAGIEVSTHANTIAGNYIGTNVAGNAALPNVGDGVVIGGANRALNVVGGTVAADRNVISGNGGRGVLITGNATSTTVAGNYIGTNAAGTGDLGNGLHGVDVNGPQNTIGGVNNTPGGLCTGACNVISGNGAALSSVDGVLISAGTGNKVNGNYIGVNVNGTLGGGLSNELRGIETAATSSGTIIGEGDSSTRNVISGNKAGGILLSGFSNEATTVRGNFIGVDATGAVSAANQGDGISMDTSNNTIGGANGLTPGGACSGDCNVISGNTPGDGIEISAGSGNQVHGNFIGTDVSGTLTRSNGSIGLRTSGTATSNAIGGTARNVISGNATNGVTLGGSGGNTLTGNYIGVDTTGTVALPNPSSGVEINSPNNYLFLGVISGNLGHGVAISGASATGNTVEDVSIGVDSGGLIDLGNSSDGVRISSGASGNFIGNGNGPENTIAGNGNQGIEMNGAGVNNVVLGNTIGKFFDGSGHANGSHGVLIVSTNDADIGHLTADVQGNFINGNPGDGVHVTSGTGTLIGSNRIRDSVGDGVHVAAGSGHRITRNIIERSAGLAIDLAGGTQDSYGVTANDASPDSDSGANNLQNYPVITLVDYDVGTVIQGTLDSALNTAYTLQFFYSDACDLSGHGEAAVFLHETSVTTDGAGHNNFSTSFGSPPGFTALSFVSATAIDPAGNTSEFSTCQLGFNDENDDNDAFLDTLETACGSNPMDPASLPERIDTVGDDDLDGATNEALPGTALPVDCDRDGFLGENETGTPLCLAAKNDDGPFDAGDTDFNDGCPAVGAVESICGAAFDDDGDGRINDGCPQFGAYSEATFKIGTSQQDPCGNTGWPLEFVTTGGSANKVDLVDLARFVAPIRRLDKNPGETGFDSRWDLAPGSNTAKLINVVDMAAMITGATGFPPMLGTGVKALGGPPCPSPP